MKKFLSSIIILSLLALVLVGCAGGEGSSDGGHVTFANAGWDSAYLHNAITGTIAEQVFRYT